MLRSLLHSLDLSENESNLYEKLLSLGQVPIGQLVKETDLKRPTVYKTIWSLEKKGLVKTEDVQKKLNVYPTSPEKISELISKKEEELRQTKENMLGIISHLSTMYTLSTERPVFRVFEGVKGLKEIYMDLLRVNEPVFAILQAAEVDPDLYEWLTQVFVKKRVKMKIHVKAIVASSKKSAEYTAKSKEEFRISKMVDSSKYPFQHEIDIYGDKVAIIHYKKSEPLIGIVIHHPNIAKTMKAWFDLAWDSRR